MERNAVASYNAKGKQHNIYKYSIVSRLHKVPNSAAKLVVTARTRDGVQPVLQPLPWLPVTAGRSTLHAMHGRVYNPR